MTRQAWSLGAGSTRPRQTPRQEVARRAGSSQREVRIYGAEFRIPAAEPRLAVAESLACRSPAQSSGDFDARG